MYFICCKILGIEPGSDIETVKTAFRKLAKELHPDLNPSDKAHQYFIIVQNAYQYILEHPYTKTEVEILIKQKREIIYKSKVSFDHAMHFRPNPLSTKTLREILRSSLTARVMFLIFHVLFISVGLFLIYSPIYDFFFYPVDTRYTSNWTYLVLIFGLIFGILFTSIFLYTGIRFIRNR